MFEDMVFAFRLLRRAPGFAAAAIVTLALGIGANTAIFSIVDSAVLRPLPYDQPDRLVTIALHNPTTNKKTTGASPREFLDWRDRKDVFDEVSVIGGGVFTLVGTGEPEEIRIARVSAGYFEMLRARVARGRTFTRDDEFPDRPKVAVISDDFWKTRFSSDPSVIGKTVRLNDQPYEIVGLLPASFEYPVAATRQTPIFLPFVFSAEDRLHGVVQSRGASPVARLRAGVSIAEAEAWLSQLQAAGDAGRASFNQGYTRAELKPLIENYVADARSWMLMLLGAVALVLLIACANVANLVLAHGSARVRELTVRGALGASRWRIARQLLTESMLLSTMGAVAGVLVAWWSLALFRVALPASIPRSANVGLDARVLLFTTAIALLTGLICGLAPAFQNSKPDLVRGLKDATPSSTGGRAGRRVRNGLAIVEVSLAVMLLVGAGLFISSFIRLLNVEQGFDASGIATLAISAPRGTATGPAGYRSQMLHMLAAVRAVPGVEVAVAESGGPYEGGYSSFPIKVPGRPEPAPNADPDMIRFRKVSTGFLDMLRVPVLRGRPFAPADAVGAPVALINDAAAREFWGAANPIGQPLTIEKTTYEIVGVVGDMRYSGPASKPAPEAFLPFEQSARSYATFIYRAPERSVPALKAAIWSVNPSQPIDGPRTSTEMFGRATATRRFNTLLMSIFGVLALAIAATGIYGVIAFLVNQRTREIGVRVALGARRSQIVRLFLKQGALLLAIGIAGGLLAAWLLGGTVRAFLFGVEPANPTVFASVAAALAAIGLLACWIPARRASRIQPVAALRSE